ncbi:hypothetical protein E2320_008779 [Naja naja]|nr:hypothetical protein E2320_008779 [Naja naja]
MYVIGNLTESPCFLQNVQNSIPRKSQVEKEGKSTGTRRSLYSKPRASSASMSSSLSFAEDPPEKLLGPANILRQVLPPTFS